MLVVGTVTTSATRVVLARNTQPIHWWPAGTCGVGTIDGRRAAYDWIPARVRGRRVRRHRESPVCGRFAPLTVGTPDTHPIGRRHRLHLTASNAAVCESAGGSGEGALCDETPSVICATYGDLHEWDALAQQRAMPSVLAQTRKARYLRYTSTLAAARNRARNSAETGGWCSSTRTTADPGMSRRDDGC